MRILNSKANMWKGAQALKKKDKRFTKVTKKIKGVTKGYIKL